MEHNELRKLAEAASHDGHIYTHPRDSNHWQANQAWHRAASPAVVVALLDELESIVAGGVERLRSGAAREYPPLPDLEDSRNPLWSAISEWEVASDPHEIVAAASEVDRQIIAALRAYVDADRAQSAQAAPSIEDLCARIKAADDAAADNDYMLDSDDCIKVLRGEWKAPLAMDKPTLPTPKAEPAPTESEAVAALRDQIDRLCNGIEHYRDTEHWSEADEEELETARELVALCAGVEAQPAVEPVAWLHTDRLGGVQAFTTEPPPGLKEKCQPLFTSPAPAPNALDAEPLFKPGSITDQVIADVLDDAKCVERWKFIRQKLCLTGNGDGTCAMHAINLPACILGWPEPGQVAEFCESAIDRTIAAQSAQGAKSCPTPGS